MKDNVRIGIIGSGFAADFHINVYNRCPYAEVVAVAGRDERKVKKLCQRYHIPKFYTDYKKMLRQKDIDMVSVCTPNYFHKEPTISAAESGKHVICEKPLATKVEDGIKMIEACKKNRVKLMYAEDWLFAPAIKRAKSICDDGALGKILYIKAKESHSGSHSVYASKLKYCGGGAMLHLGIHPIGFAHWFKGKQVVEVTAKTSGGGKKNLKLRHFEGEDWADAILTFEDNTHALIEANYVTLGGLDDVVEIYGAKGRMRINISQGSPISLFTIKGYDYAVEKAETTIGWSTPAVDERLDVGYVDEMAYFISCVRDDKEPMFGVRGEDGLTALEITQAIYKSAREGKSVKLPLRKKV